MTTIPYDITARPGFEPVVDVFKSHFETGIDHGAQFCVYQHGNMVLDLLGGWADRKKTQPVTENTLFAVFSAGKAVAALTIALLFEDDRIGYEQLLSSVWPEFSGHRKETLTIAQALSHQAGVTGITASDWTAQDWYDPEKCARYLAAQEPLFQPASASGYHAQTYGIICAEIARRSDVSGRSLGAIFRQEIAEPHGLDIWIGLPESEHARCADMIKPRAAAKLGNNNAAKRAAFLSPGASPDRKDLKRWRLAEFPASNTHATAHSLAQLMQVLVSGSLNGAHILSEDTLAALKQTRIAGQDQVLPFEIEFAAGIMRNARHFSYGPNPDTVGHSGWGGACVFTDPDLGISGAYAMSRQDNTLIGDARPRALIDALYSVL